MFKTIFLLVSFVALAAFNSVGAAQEPATVGDILGKGGKKLTKDEAVKLLTGATVTGPQVLDRSLQFEMTYEATGTASGFGSQKTIKVIGKWWINEQGQLCTELENSNRLKFGNCSFYFVLGSSYYLAINDETATPLYDRQVKR